MSETAVRAADIEVPHLRTRGLRGWWKDPWRKPRILSALTWA